MPKIEVYSRDRLVNSISQVSKFNQRDIVRSIEMYLGSDSLEILGLYGLRRTGKTVAMLHAIQNVGIDNCRYIYCNAHASFDELVDVLKEVEKSTKFIFIDEVTNCDFFSDDAMTLSSLFTECGTKLVIAGTDSLQLNIAERHTLLGRIIMVNTVHCTYPEYKKLHVNATVDDYLMSDTVHEPKVFSTLKSCDTYIDDAIIDNIWNSVNKTEDTTYLGIARACSKHTLGEALYKCIDKVSTLCAEKTLIKCFKESGISAAANGLHIKVNHNYSSQLGFVTDFKTTSVADMSKLSRWLLESLNIISTVKEHNIDAGVMTDRGILLMPGMQFRLASECIRVFQEENPNVISSEKVNNILLGMILEDTIVYHTHNARKVKFNNGEFDMLVYNPSYHTCDIYEIKHSDKIIADQYKYLVNSNIVEKVYGKVDRRIVLYYGQTTMLPNGILYKNVEEYLLGK